MPQDLATTGGRGKAVSAPLMIWMVFLFATAGIYGWRVTNSGALIFSGIIRTPLQVSILFALIYRKGLRKWERYLLYGCGGTIGTALGTSSSVWISGVFLTASVGLTIFAFLQLMETILLGRGQMGIAFLGVNATSTVFWTWYAFVFNDPLLKWTTTPVMVITLFTVLAWYKVLVCLKTADQSKSTNRTPNPNCFGERGFLMSYSLLNICQALFGSLFH